MPRWRPRTHSTNGPAPFPTRSALFLFRLRPPPPALFQPPAVNGVGSFGGFQFILQDQGKNTLSDLDRVAHQIVGASRARKDLVNLLTTFSANDPQILVTIDREKAKAMGIPLSQITTTLGVFMGSLYVNDFDYNNRTYRVYVQADQPFRMNARDLHGFYVRSDSNQMIPLDSLVIAKETAGPQVISHYNLFRSVEIDGSSAPGKSSSERDVAIRRSTAWPKVLSATLRKESGTR